MNTDDKAAPKYSCLLCGIGFDEGDLEDGLAVVRSGEYYCRKCFTNEFANDCVNHPGVKAVAACSICARRFCADCLIDILGSPVCAGCKGLALVRLRQGTYGIKLWKRSQQSPYAIFVAGILGFLFCGLFSGLAVYGYLMHRIEVQQGIAKRNRFADIGFALGLVWILLFLVVVITGVILPIFPFFWMR